jgi:hypothetical protein
MWDAWAAYNHNANTYLHHERAHGLEDDQNEAISYAAYRVLCSRFANSPGAVISFSSFDSKMHELGYDTNFTSTVGFSPAALGNRIAKTVLQFGANDNANEVDGYANRLYTPSNPPLNPRASGNPNIADPNRWQPLALGIFVDQSGNIFLGALRNF